MRNNLYLVESIGHVDWDEVAGQVIAAKDARSARKIANERFNNPFTCKLIGKAEKGIEGLVLEDFKAG